MLVTLPLLIFSLLNLASSVCVCVLNNYSSLDSIPYVKRRVDLKKGYEYRRMLKPNQCVCVCV